MVRSRVKASREGDKPSPWRASREGEKAPSSSRACALLRRKEIRCISLGVSSRSRRYIKHIISVFFEFKLISPLFMRVSR